MKYPYWVRHNGIDYPPNTEIEDKPVATEKVVEEPIVEEVKEPEVEEEKPTITKTEINRMSTADLKELAKANKLPTDKSGADLKKLLIEKFGL